MPHLRRPMAGPPAPSRLRAAPVRAALLSACLVATLVVAAPAAQAGAPDLAGTTAPPGPMAPLATGIHRCAHTGSAAGFTGNTLVTAIAIGMAESRCNPSALNVSPNGSRDRGLWQINDRAHPGVSDACAFNPQCNADAAFTISKGGTDWWPWTVYRNGRYQDFLNLARAAAYRPLRRDFNQDGPPDLLARRGDNQNLHLYRGTTGGSLMVNVPLGDWRHFDFIVPAGDFDKNGRADVLARRGDSGNLYLYRGNGTGRFSQGPLLGDFSNFNLITAVGDWDGDGNPDLLARSRSSGHLYLYRGNGSGGLHHPFIRISTTNWNNFTHIVGAGDLNNDGHMDLLARRDSGNLYVYPGVDGTGLGGYRLIGDWRAFDQIVGAGDWDRDGNIDVVSRRASDGRLVLHRGNGSFGFLGSRVFHASDWRVFDIVS